MPTTLHRTYCRVVVIGALIDNETPTCDECMDAKVWEEIDSRREP